MFGLAARVEDWPELLPHYRWVRIHRQAGSERVVEMAARRQVVGRLGVPLWWVAIQTLYPTEQRIEFRHIGGLTRGMWVEWRVDADMVSIQHVFRPRWPIPDAIVRSIVGEYFVNGVAQLTLARLGELAQRTS